MSGGVDSSVAAHLLVREGHDVVGVFMRHGQQGDSAELTRAGAVSQLPIVAQQGGHKQGCCSALDARDAQRVADQLGVPFYALNFEEEFGQIVDYFVQQYSAGRTPNPCVMCNNWVKFGKLFDYADSIEAEFIATGHYARIGRGESGRVELRRGTDTSKEQSYVLFGVQRQQLDRMLLPVGDYRKPQIRALACQLGLDVASKPDSQEICFVPSGDHAQFVKARRGSGDASGQIVTTDGRVVGTHRGIERFTIGQRRGLAVALGEPYYVVRIQADSRRVVIGKYRELARSELVATNVNWLVDRPKGPLSCLAQIRYNSGAVPAMAEPLAEGRLRVEFDQPCFGVAPGQAVVCYDGDRVLCGGWIE
jgi:tRNA-specific 2-thiouridylase